MVNNVSLATAAVGLMCSVALIASESAKQADRAFVAKVSQGGLYEVEAGLILCFRHEADSQQR